MRRKFIAFEGIDGAGLTTQATLLRNWMIKKGYDTLLTKEPSDGLIGGIIKASLRREWKTTPLALRMLFVADRAHHVATEIEPALRNSKNVITDRYVLSSIAYGSLDISMEVLRQLNAEFRKPNVTFIMDAQPAVCLDRIKRARHHVELYEQEQKLHEIRKNFLSLKRIFPETHVIDANRPPEQVFKDIQKIIMNLD